MKIPTPQQFSRCNLNLMLAFHTLTLHQGAIVLKNEDTQRKYKVFHWWHHFIYLCLLTACVILNDSLISKLWDYRTWKAYQKKRCLKLYQRKYTVKLKHNFNHWSFTSRSSQWTDQCYVQAKVKVSTPLYSHWQDETADGNSHTIFKYKYS